MSIEFIAWLFVAFPVGVVIHELGHWAAGRLVGLRVLACGVGPARPLIAFTALGTRWFLGWPPTGGITVSLARSWKVERFRQVFSILGGAAANAAVAAVALGASSHGGGDPARAFFWTSVWLAGINLIPMHVDMMGVSLQNDARLALDACRGMAPGRLSGGRGLTAAEGVLGLMRRIGCPEGVGVYGAVVAAVRLELGDVVGARRTLEESRPAVLMRGLPEELRDHVDRCVAILEADPDGPLEDASNPVPRTGCLLCRAGALLEADRDATGALHEATIAARESGRPDLVTACDVVQFLASPPADLDVRLDELLGRTGPRQPTEVAKAQLLVAAARASKQAGDDVAWLRYARRAADRIAAIAGEIRDETVRRVYIQGVARRLDGLAAEVALAVEERHGRAEPCNAASATLAGNAALILLVGVSATLFARPGTAILGWLFLPPAALLAAIGAWLGRRERRNLFVLGLAMGYLLVMGLLGNPARLGLAAGREELALGRYERARSHFGLADAGRRIGWLDDAEALEALEGRAFTYRILGWDDEALDSYEELVDLAESLPASEATIDRARFGLLLMEAKVFGASPEDLVEARRLAMDSPGVSMRDLQELFRVSAESYRPEDETD